MRARRSGATFAVLGLLSACQMVELRRDLRETAAQARELSGDITVTEDSTRSVPPATPLVVMLIDSAEAPEARRLLMQPGPGPVSLQAPTAPVAIFAFADANLNLRLDAEEARGWANGGVPLATGENRFTIEIGSSATLPLPRVVRDGAVLDWSELGGLTIHVGTVTPLASGFFSREQADVGLWQPLAFLKNGGAGVHFLDAYRPDREPVLFVHGINGTPQEFEPLIDALDRSRFQAWVVSYPSGLRLGLVSRGVQRIVTALHHRYHFEKLHVVAHSMGGIVSRGFINECLAQPGCDYLTSLTTIGTPWGGHAAATLGVKYAPEAVPVWYDMAPDSEYLRRLFETRLPASLPHHLFFTFKRGDWNGAENSDGAVTLSSQLRYEAQAQARTRFGFNEDHAGVLASALLAEKVAEVLTGR